MFLCLWSCVTLGAEMLRMECVEVLALPSLDVHPGLGVVLCELLVGVSRKGCVGEARSWRKLRKGVHQVSRICKKKIISSRV